MNVSRANKYWKSDAEEVSLIQITLESVFPKKEGLRKILMEGELVRGKIVYIFLPS